MTADLPFSGKRLCLDIEAVSEGVVRYDHRSGLKLRIGGEWMRGKGVTKEQQERSSPQNFGAKPRRRRRRPGEKMRAPSGKFGGTLVHQQVMHQMRCQRWNVPCKCSAHTPFPDGFVLKVLPGGPAARCAAELRRVLSERGLVYVTGEVGVIVDPTRRVGTHVDGVAASKADARELWVLELKTGHRHVGLPTLNKHKAQTRAGMNGLHRLLGGQKDKRRVVGGLLIYLAGDRACVRVEEILWK